MKKSLIALAVAAAVIAPSANATTTLYGKVRQSISQVDGIAFGGGYNFATGTGGVATTSDATRIHDQSSRLGVKGSEDLGNGLSAIYQFEFGVGVNDNEKNSNGGGSTGFSNRNQFVGLKGGFGTFLIGRHDTPAKMALGKIPYWFGAQHEADDAIGLGFNSGKRVDNTIAYISPSMGGLTFMVATIAGEADSVDGTDTADGLADGVSAALKYSNGPFYAALGYTQRSKELLGVSDDEDIMGLALAYTPGPWGIGYMYENTDTGTTGGSGTFGGTYIDSVDLDGNGSLDDTINLLSSFDEYETHLLVGSYKFGNNVVKAKYGQGTLSGSGVADVDVDVWGLWLEHNLSKRTKVFMAYSQKEVDDFVVTDSAGLTASVDGSSDLFSLGLEHSF